MHLPGARDVYDFFLHIIYFFQQQTSGQKSEFLRRVSQTLEINKWFMCRAVVLLAPRGVNGQNRGPRGV